MFGTCSTILKTMKEKNESGKWEHHILGESGSKKGNGKVNFAISIYLAPSAEFSLVANIFNDHCL